MGYLIQKFLDILRALKKNSRGKQGNPSFFGQHKQGNTKIAKKILDLGQHLLCNV